MYGLDLVSGEALAQHADDRDSASDGRAEVDVYVVLRSRLEYLASVLREELLVRGDDALSVAERREDERLRDARAADRLDDDVHLGVSEDGSCVRREHTFGDADAAVRRDVEVRNLLEYNVDAEALRHDVAMLQKTVGDSCADGSESEYSDSNLLHILPFCN